MKILWFTNSAVNFDDDVLAGGWMQSLAYYLSLDKDIQLYITTRANGKSIRIIETKNITFIFVPEKRSLLQKRIDLFLGRDPIDFYLSENIKVVNEVQPDIIHVFGSEMDYGLISGSTDIPVVIHIQGILHSCYYQLKAINIPFFKTIFSSNVASYIKGDTFHNGLSIFKRRVNVEEKILRKCSYFTGRTEWDRRVTRLLAPNASYYHCDEILRSPFLAAKWSQPNSEIVNIVSTISSPFYKGHETLVATCYILKKSGLRFVWNVIGLNVESKTFKVFYKEHFAELGPNIHLHGELKPDKIIDVLMSSNIYVHPSHIENSSNSLCEAMAVGMPVIALYVGGNTSMISHEEDGLLVPDNDPYFLAAMIIDVLKNKEMASQLGRTAKTKAAVRHDPDRIANRLKVIYNNLIDSNENQ